MSNPTDREAVAKIVDASALLVGADLERAACAELVSSAGCLCKDLMRANLTVLLNYTEDYCEWHDPRCPKALARAIEARGAA